MYNTQYTLTVGLKRNKIMFFMDSTIMRNNGLHAHSRTSTYSLCFAVLTCRNTTCSICISGNQMESSEPPELPIIIIPRVVNW